MTPFPTDQSRDRRIEDPTNLWIIHPAGRRLLPGFVARGVSANAVSIGGMVLGTLAALAYAHWDSWPYAIIGLLMSVGWLIADGLDGMIARATGTASALGRALDGLVDHGVFILIYVSIALSIDTAEGWILACSAGAAHAVQSNLYESERARFHRRCKGIGIAPPQVRSRNPLVIIYDYVLSTLDRFAFPFDDALRRHGQPADFGAAYGVAALRPMRLMSLLTANVRVYAIFLACLFGNPRAFWWFELVPLTGILIVGVLWHRAVEARLIHGQGVAPGYPSQSDSTSSQRT
jgi:phosphatidylglycerophosphate synthase